MKILNKKKYKFQCRQCDTEILFSKEDCWVDRTYEDLWLTCPVCGRRHDNQTYGLFRQEYIEEYDEKDKEIEILDNRIDKAIKYIEKVTSYDGQCYFDLGISDCYELLNILKGDDKN